MMHTGRLLYVATEERDIGVPGTTDGPVPGNSTAIMAPDLISLRTCPW